MNTTSNHYYKVGGSLDRDAPSYGVRQADEDFYQALKAGEFCYVLNSRQMGKSSLRVRTVGRLEAEGIACSQIDITSIGSRGITASEWYWGVMRRLARSFKTSIDLKTWWQERAEASPVDRLSQFIEEVLLVEVKSSIAIFIDEIDSILNLDFKDDFFALIRTCYNQRAENPEYRRLTFALLGVATPSDLIQDKSRTPFNIGRSIDLRGLQLHEAEPLAQGLQEKAEDAISVLKSILDWTCGQPFLTQKICQVVQSETDWISAGQEAERVQLLVQSRVIENWEGQDEPEHLRTIQNRLMREDERKGQLLGLYQQVLEQETISATESEEQIRLRLSGLVVKDQGQLKPHNRIYAAVFDRAWVERILAELRPYAEAISAWLLSNCEDESRLLRGQALHDALDWAEGKLLTQDDNQFLAQSQRLRFQELELQLGQEIKEKEAILRSRAFKFGTKEVNSISALIELCDQYIGEAEKYLFDGSFQTWLLGNLGDTVLAQSTKIITDTYRGSDTRKGLELFVRELCKRVGIMPYPQILLQPNTVQFHNLMVGEQKNAVLKFNHQGRGFVWGKVEIVGSMPGLRLESHQFNSLDSLTILLDTLDVNPGEYQGRIVCIPVEVSSTYDVPIYYTIQDFQIYSDSSEKYLGTFLQGQDATPTDIELELVSAQKLRVEVTTTDLLLVQVLGVVSSKQFRRKSNTIYEQDKLKIRVIPNLNQAKNVRLYQETIFLAIGTKKLSIPIKFRVSYNWKKAIGKYSISAILTAAIMWMTRLWLRNFYPHYLPYKSYEEMLHLVTSEKPFVVFLATAVLAIGFAGLAAFIYRKYCLISNYIEDMKEILRWLIIKIWMFVLGTKQANDSDSALSYEMQEFDDDDYDSSPLMKSLGICVRAALSLGSLYIISYILFPAVSLVVQSAQYMVVNTVAVILLFVSFPISFFDHIGGNLGKLIGTNDPAIAWCLLGFLLQSVYYLIRYLLLKPL
ncbi:MULTISPECIES: AAA-like domain-containing protein [Leptolyngbya]|uniref:AAA-like domain-containing protein n=1 Tax=Leptolyngbya TaxID=47251 RepID=UPI00168436C4|nr:AAA-like domain-containing protein [Leptolyngbya sp. FACHB-1624]MBD1857682.1 AAA-like domain-containing protein [Leptolyngbya sp. FACHB-1624]